MKLNRKQLSLAIARALSAGAAVGMVAPMAFAQTPTSPVVSEVTKALTPETQKLERVEVTGSRIPSATVTSESPVTVISAQDIKWTGLTQTSDILNQLPQVSPEFGGNLSNGSTGTASVNLRGLGSQRTLVLIDGKRVPAGSVNIWSTDINAIPSNLIQRVEVLSGGASSIYGSDAVAGVVNFIMNDHFEGIQFDWTGNGYNHQQHSFVGDIVAGKEATNPVQYHNPGNVSLDGETQTFSVTMGSNFANGKGNATVYFEYKNVQPVLQGTRDFSACSLVGGNSAYTCGGSSTSYPGRFTDFSNFNLTIANPAGGVRNYVGSHGPVQLRPVQLLPAQRHAVPGELLRPLRRAAERAGVHRIRLHGRPHRRADRAERRVPAAVHAQRQQSAAVAGLQERSGAFRFQSELDVLHRPPQPRRWRSDRLVHPHQLSHRAGSQGQHSRGQVGLQLLVAVRHEPPAADLPERLFGGPSRPGDGRRGRLAPERNAGMSRSFLDGTDPNCVPYDIFHIGGVTQAAVNYLSTPGFQTGYTSQSVVGLTVSSDLGASYGWTLPWAKDGIGFAAGIERRVEKLSTSTDVEFDTGDLAGQGGATHGLSGQYTVSEAYAEARIPIVQRQPMAYDLSVSGSYRYSDYSTNQTTNSYGIGADWAPVKEGKIRGSYQQAVRAANIIELFSQQGYNLFNGTDPCAPGQTATLAQCLRTGLLASQYHTQALASPAGQFNYLQGGNPTLEPETAKTYTLGGVLQLPNLSATLDYWHYDVENMIGIVQPQQALNNCINTGVNCDLIHRGPNGNLWLPNQGYVSGLNQNLGSFKTDGIDISINYNLPIQNYGSLGFAFIGTWVNEFIVEPIRVWGSYDCAGLFGTTCGVPTPTWRHRFQTVWNTPWYGISGALTWRYVDSVSLDLTRRTVDLGDGLPAGRAIGAQNYFDLALQWPVNKNFTIRGGVNNIVDRDPPVVSSTLGAFPAISGPAFGNGNTYPQVYDTLGRNFFLNVTAKF